VVCRKYIYRQFPLLQTYLMSAWFLSCSHQQFISIFFTQLTLIQVKVYCMCMYSWVPLTSCFDDWLQRIIHMGIYESSILQHSAHKRPRKIIEYRSRSDAKSAAECKTYCWPMHNPMKAKNIAIIFSTLHCIMH